MGCELPDGVVGVDGLSLGVWKYVVVTGKSPRFTKSEGGLRHVNLVLPGECAYAAGFILLSDDGEWLHVNANSETLEIAGDIATDVAMLAEALGRPPMVADDK
jgi:hypothetical protein